MEATLKYRSRLITGEIAPFMDGSKKVLDIGCGNGIVSTEIARHFNCEITGTDIHNHLVRAIRFKNILNGGALDFSDGEFDAGLFNDVLHHVPFDLQAVLIREAVRVCRKVLVFEVKPTFAAKLIDFPLNWISDIKVPVPLTHRDSKGWALLFDSNNISYTFYPVRRPSFWYPFVNYLFCLEGKRC